MLLNAKGGAGKVERGLTTLNLASLTDWPPKAVTPQNPQQYISDTSWLSRFFQSAYLASNSSENLISVGPEGARRWEVGGVAVGRLGDKTRGSGRWGGWRRDDTSYKK